MQEFLERTSSKSAIEQEEWNKYIVKEESIIETMQDDEDLMAESIDSYASAVEEPVNLTSSSSTKKRDQSQKTPEKTTGEDEEWKQVLASNEKTSTWVERIAADIDELAKNDTSDKE